MSQQQRVALVTGGAGGIGTANASEGRLENRWGARTSAGVALGVDARRGITAVMSYVGLAKRCHRVGSFVRVKGATSYVLCALAPYSP